MIGQLWPLVVESNISEKPSVVQLQNEFCQVIDDNFNTMDIKQEVNTSVKVCAKALVMAAETPQGMLPDLSYILVFCGLLFVRNMSNI